jgi:hypothetical protein
MFGVTILLRVSGGAGAGKAMQWNLTELIWAQAKHPILAAVI